MHLTPPVEVIVSQVAALPTEHVAALIEGLIGVLDARTPDADLEPDEDGECNGDDYRRLHGRDQRDMILLGMDEDAEPEEEGCCEAGDDLGIERSRGGKNQARRAVRDMVDRRPGMREALRARGAWL